MNDSTLPKQGTSTRSNTPGIHADFDLLSRDAWTASAPQENAERPPLTSQDLPPVAVDDPPLLRRQIGLLKDLLDSAALRSQSEQALTRQLESARDTAVHACYERRDAAQDAHDREIKSSHLEYSQRSRELTEYFSAQNLRCLDEHEGARHLAIEQHEQTLAQSNQQYQDERSEASEHCEIQKNQLAALQEQAKITLQKLLQEITTIAQPAQEWLIKCRLGEVALEPEAEDDTAEPVTVDYPLENYVTDAQRLAARLRGQWLPRLFAGWRPLAILLFTWLVISLPLCLMFVRQHVFLVSLLPVPLLGPAIGAALYWFARRRARAAWRPLRVSVVAGEAALNQHWAKASQDFQHAQVDLLRKREAVLTAALEKSRSIGQRSVEERDRELLRLDDKHERLSGMLAQQKTEGMHEAEARQNRRLEANELQFPKALRDADVERDLVLSAADESHARDWHAMADQWSQAGAAFDQGMREVQEEVNGLYPEWQAFDPADQAAIATAPSVLKLGMHQVQLARLADVVPRDPRLKLPMLADFEMPALAPFPAGASLLLDTSGAGNAAAIEVLQATLLSVLSSVPAGKLRLTMIDPVGLGQNFASFMHLADYDEAMVSHRIWTESPHIDQRLADLCEHMENVIQKYLRNEFATVDEYNAQAGEVAEPYRLLVIADFPTNFSDAAVKRLLSILQSGPRCGVYTWLMFDRRQPLPRGLSLADLKQATHLFWNGQDFIRRGAGWEQFNFVARKPPESPLTKEILTGVGRNTRDVARVEVPFASIAPAPEQYWDGDTSRGIVVPLGPAGATKTQHLSLGQGTSQHVLIAGRTGSGKSTLLHALITGAMLKYSPDELQLYLIDFKKGVEFKSYASGKVPHLRVVAIESDREFGLSVLERLDSELQMRGEAFRRAGVQDLASYRQAVPGTVLPRLMLVIDEFQELFVEDDRIAQDANLLLDRLVRQGRAFGIHILLGSQTLGGAFTLARTTLGQMGVRIALQCSEADAHHILSDDNSAARLLSRPGEAIYNDANGRLEGNHPFQVVWLADQQRDVYLQRIEQLASDRHAGPATPPIIFEGNVPAHLGENALLAAALAAPATETNIVLPTAWLGESISIKDATSAVFRRQNASNLLICGQHEGTARAILEAAAVGLLATNQQFTEELPTLFVLDGGADDLSRQTLWHTLQAAHPGRITVGGPRDAARIMGQLADELNRRQGLEQPARQSVYLLTVNLQRFRDLKKPDDDFSFSRNAETTASAGKQFASLLHDGAAQGMHTLLWADTLATLNRMFERATLREFDMRVLLQMSANDSSQMIDNPAAAKLGPYRAIFHHEEQARLEKFRPYGFADPGWINTISSAIADVAG